MGKPIKDLTEKRFGRLTVVKLDSSDGKGNVKWLCKCDCGSYVTPTRRSLEGGSTKSCGCLKVETIKITQGLTKMEYSIASGNSLYSVYKRAANRRGYEFELSKEFFFDITKQNCHYCGTKPAAEMKRKECNGNYIYNGIDRKSNAIGYIEDNCLPCCIICNKAKGTKSYEEFIKWVNKLIKYQKQ